MKQEKDASDVVEVRLAHAPATFGPTDGHMIMNDEMKGGGGGWKVVSEGTMPLPRVITICFTPQEEDRNTTITPNFHID